MSLKPPPYLEINNGRQMSQVWRQFEQQWSWYAIATELHKQPNTVQVATLMTIIGPGAIDIYNTFKLEEEEEITINEILKLFREYFTPKRNTTYERYLFNKLVQKEGQSFEEFLTEIINQSNTCDFGVLKESLIKDKIVIGVTSEELREKLLLNDSLSLEEAITLCRSYHQTKARMNCMVNNPEVDELRRKNINKEETFDCTRCGKKHGRKNCKAFNQKCTKCSLKGHFAKFCRTKKKVEALDEYSNSESEEEVMMVSTVNNCKTNKYWKEEIILPQNVKKVFKIDTGAECNVINKLIAKEAKLPINPSKTRFLQSYSQHTIQVLGETECVVKSAHKSAKIKFLVVESKKLQPVLSGNSCVILGFIKRLEMITDYKVGCLKGFKYDIDLVENCSFPIHPPRRIPYTIREQVKQELDKMVKNKIIKPVQKPTPAVSPMVIVKQRGKIRICLDPSDINKKLKRRHFPLSTIEEITAKINGSKWFTVLDCVKGFWHIKVSERTADYLTFSTPWGRYSFLRMPFGLASAPEVFQQIMCSLMEGIPNVEVAMDDILIHARTQKELKEITKVVTEKLKSAGLNLNDEKCVYEKNSVLFLGHLITDVGVRPDPSKIKVIQNIETPTNIQQLQRFLGSVTYLAKFIPNLSELTQPLRELLSKEKEWFWDYMQQQAFEKLKETIQSPPTLKYFDSKLPITLSVDASSYAVGMVLMQNNQPIAYGAKALSKTEQNYSQIEKEALAILMACRKFHVYIWGNPHVTIESDHKPLEAIMKKNLHEAPPRIQRILYEVIQYNPVVKYTKGSELHLADMLSRDVKLHPVPDTPNNVQIHVVVPFTKEKRLELKRETENEFHELLKVIRTEWPENRSALPDSLKKYWNFKNDLSVLDDIIFKNFRVLIPNKMKQTVLNCLHKSHKSVSSTLRLARDHVFWINMDKDIEEYVNKCQVCQATQKNNIQHKIKLHEVPKRPWSIVGTDLFEFKNENYILIADSYSGFFDFKKLNLTASKNVIKELKEWFAVHGVCDKLFSDNGPQYASEEFKKFAKDWNFEHCTSSPHFPRSNGLIERYVQEAKSLLNRVKRDGSDLQLALLLLRNIPRGNIGSPVQRLMGRRTKTTLPTSERLLQPKIIRQVHEELKKMRESAKNCSDKNKVQDKEFLCNQDVLLKIKDRHWVPAKVIDRENSSRSYIVKTKDGKTYRRNSWFLKNWTKDEPTLKENSLEGIKRNHSTQDNETIEKGRYTNESTGPDIKTEEVNPNQTMVFNTGPANNEQQITRSGRCIKPPDRLNL